MSSAGFKSAFPAVKRLHTYALDHTATGIGIAIRADENTIIFVNYLEANVY
jgi:hypothetical protein